MSETTTQPEISQEAARQMLAALRGALEIFNDHVPIEAMRAERDRVLAVCAAIAAAEAR